MPCALTAGYVFTVANAFKDMIYIVEMDKLLGLEHSPVNEVVLEIFRRAVEEDGLGHLLISELLALEPGASRPQASCNSKNTRHK